MLNEIEEFNAYTQAPIYEAKGKRDTSYLGRFTFDMLLDFEGLARVLTTVARGYMWKNGEPDIDHAMNALYAWCSHPDNKTASPKKNWQYNTDHSVLHDEFPELVNINGCGWFFRHVHSVCDFVNGNPEAVSKTAQKHCEKLSGGFDDAWRKKVMQFMTPIFSPSTRGAWILRFDDVLADAKELGPLCDRDYSLPEELISQLKDMSSQDCPFEALELMVKYYISYKPEDSDWVVLPVTNVDAYFGSTNFSKKWLNKMPERLIIRQKQGFGVCRYMVNLTL